MAHRAARLDLDDLQLVHGYGGWRAYSNSKLCNILFTAALARRMNPSRIVAHAMHPGVVSTRFASNNGMRGRLLRQVMDWFSVTPEQGADTIVWLASADGALSGSGYYWEKRARQTPSTMARSGDVADRLWEISASLAHIDADRMIAEAGVAAAS